MKVHYRPTAEGTVEWWYERDYRVWYAARFDHAGNQLCDAEHAATKAEILDRVDAMEETAGRILPG